MRHNHRKYRRRNNSSGRRRRRRRRGSVEPTSQNSPRIHPASSCPFLLSRHSLRARSWSVTRARRFSEPSSCLMKGERGLLIWRT
ncbi:hypothetical protein I7I53_09749 [Histoplasma capsulatum var. duboisii H88]|uniref:Uncharacterized protein n=1 Tax=Ajellomyces capsulatus (strain H88) TaxID=544711 RepID=A0A8A1L712_AJEC8|nr:hypothetical protein I7I53_09749 [Histoplasma capsulatum var. duboisii H88]